MDNHKDTHQGFAKGMAFGRGIYVLFVIFPLIIIILGIEKKLFLPFLVIFSFYLLYFCNNIFNLFQTLS